MRIGISLPVRELQDDLAAIREFAVTAEELGFTHLRVPDLVIRPGSGELHEPMTLLAWAAGFTSTIELVPSVIILPERQTALFAKQAAEVDILSGGRLRVGVGVGTNAEEYEALGQDFRTRGRRVEEQIELLRRLWTQESVDFEGRWHRVSGAGIAPLPVQRPIPLWVGPGSAGGRPVASVLRRVGRLADGWFAIIDRELVPEVSAQITEHAREAGRDPSQIGIEGAISAVGRPTSEWFADADAWSEVGVTHLCLRTLGAGLDAAGHLAALREVHAALEAR